VTNFFGKLWSQEEGQDIAEYAVMLAVILVIVVGTLRLIWRECKQRVFCHC
jgi:Flp pilus assembly pilin Flp